VSDVSQGLPAQGGSRPPGGVPIQRATGTGLWVHPSGGSKWGSGFPTMPADGMSMWPPLSPWVTITGRCWPGGHHRLPTLGISPARGNYAINLGKRYILRGIYAILATSR
jgi:hypothetical protein